MEAVTYVPGKPPPEERWFRLWLCIAGIFYFVTAIIAGLTG